MFLRRAFVAHAAFPGRRTMAFFNIGATETKAEDVEYDLAVIGGGSGGMACAKEAAALGAKVALFDYVAPSPHGSKWGIGGTCVNVGCVPKKIMHYAALLGHSQKHMQSLGWEVSKTGHNWSHLVQQVQSHVAKLSFSYGAALSRAGVKVYNEHAKLHADGVESDQGLVRAKNVLVAVGGRPYVPPEDEVPGARELALTSDDIFSLKTEPGRTLVVGAGYIALECAGFLQTFGHETTVAVRSQPLRGFDRQCADKVVQHMQQGGVQFVNELPAALHRVDAGDAIRVEWGDGRTDEYDTVVYATGRRPSTESMQLEAQGVDTLDGKVLVDDLDRSVSNNKVFAVGDCAFSRPELTPAAVRAGELLARRLFGDSDVPMDYDKVPTAVFTPVEYGCVGLSEEDAVVKYGEDNVEVYMWEFTTLEHQAAGEEATNCLSKLVCHLPRPDAPASEQTILGAHFVGPNAGEQIQHLALAVKLGVSKSEIDQLVGVHPTDAESFVDLTVTRRSGESYIASGGCGGGKCG
ncbi:MAG: hypothetical protein MHM6MM_002274 [Cercozoa sp. M6MM]